MSMAGRSIASLVTFDVGENTSYGIFRIVVRSVLIALLLFIGYTGYEGWHNEYIPGFLEVGAVISFLMWGSERIWKITVMPMIAQFPWWGGLASKLPFWFLGGGIGYTAGMLTAKKLGLLIVYDRPVEMLFLFGGKFGMTIQLVASVIAYRMAKQEKEQAR